VTAVVLDGIEGVRAAVGREFGPTGWLEITQDRIDRFAAATGDDQWIHVDPARAAAGPFGRTIAHGYLTVALSNRFLPELFDVANIAMGINYGVDRIRFPEPVPVGSRLRARAAIVEVADVPGGVQAKVRVTIEREGSERPACVIDALSRYLT
jgi:acyl dehydratase